MRAETRSPQYSTQVDSHKAVNMNITSLASRVLDKLFSERIVLTGLCGLLAAFSLWLQFVVLEDEPVAEEIDDTSPDFYLENFAATGMDDQGSRRYRLEAQRAVHYPTGEAVLDFPHVIQYQPGSAPRHTYADSGAIEADGTTILLTGNVRVLQGHNVDSNSPGGIQTSNRMKIRLKDKIGS